jgi:hypothetical protein
MDIDMKSTDSDKYVVNASVGLAQKKTKDPKKRLQPEKRDIKDVAAFAPDDFVYTKPLGEGAFGKVRKCEFEMNKSSENPEEESTKSVSPNKKIEDLKEKIETDEKYKHMAVKI